MRLSWKGYPQGAVHGVREPVRRLVSRVCIRLWMTAVGDVLKTPIIEVSPRTVRVRRERVWVTPGLLSLSSSAGQTNGSAFVAATQQSQGRHFKSYSGIQLGHQGGMQS